MRKKELGESSAKNAAKRELTPSEQAEISTYHRLAKEAGNRLRAYILSVSSGATGIYFLTMTSAEKGALSRAEKCLLILALTAFVLTVCICLYELRVDSKRFFALTKELEKPEDEQCWDDNERYKCERRCLINFSYAMFTFAILFTVAYLAMKIKGN